MAHTPGPFVAEPLGVAQPFEYAVATASGDILAYVRREADADLFAAAPELYAFVLDYLRRRNDAQFDNRWTEVDERACAILREIGEEA